MHIGLSTMNNLHRCRPEALARMLEARGYESLWIGEHAHLPAVPKSPYPNGGAIPESYKHMADPFISLSLAAAATTKLKFGLGVALILEREPFGFAKEVASFDTLSGGRLVGIGIGVGWNREEFENVARMPWNRRYAGLKECAAALRALWTQDEASFKGEWYNFDRVWCYPKPLQKPHPKVTLGVAGEIGTRHAAEWGDAWNPIDRGGDFAGMLASFRKQVRGFGRDPDKIEITATPMMAPTLDRLRMYRDLGVHRAIVGGGVAPEDEAATEAYVDSFAKWVEELR